MTAGAKPVLIAGGGIGGLADPEIVEGMERIGPELDTGTDFAQHCGLFQQDRGNALLRQP